MNKANNAVKIDVAKGNPWRDTRGRFDGDPFDFLKDRGVTSYVSREDNEKKIKASEKKAKDALTQLRKEYEATDAGKAQQIGNAGIDRRVAEARAQKEADRLAREKSEQAEIAKMAQDSAAKEDKRSNAVVSEEEAKKAASKGALAGKVFYHGTDAEAGKGISKKGFNTSTGENQVFGEGIYMTSDAIDAQGYAENKSFEDNKATIVSAYIDAKNVFTKKSKPSIEQTTMERLIESGVLGEGENLKTFDHFRAWDDTYREVITELLEKYDAVEIPGTVDRPAYILVKDTKSIKIFNVGDAKDTADKYFEGLQDEE